MNEIYKANSKLKRLQKEFDQYKRESVKWSVEDFTELAKEMGYKCSKKKAQELLETMIRKHDASLGISWITLEVYIQDNCESLKKMKPGNL